MNVTFNSRTCFGENKKLPYTNLKNTVKETLIVVDPFEAKSAMDGFSHNTAVVEKLPHSVLQTAIHKVFAMGLKTKPSEFKNQDKYMKPILKNLVNDTTEIGDEARKILNTTTIDRLSKAVKR